MKLKMLTTLGLEHLSAGVSFLLGFPKSIPNTEKQRV